MKKGVLLVCLLIVLPVTASGITPVHLGRVAVDTSLYDSINRINISFVPGPFTNWKYNPGAVVINDLRNSPMIIQAFLRKNSNQFDLYSYNGKIGVAVIPKIRQDGYSCSVCFSCYLVDDDDGWETLVNVYTAAGNLFEVYDGDGTILLADTGTAYYGVDFNNTYVVAIKQFNGYQSYDSWRFRTNISTESPKSLAKTKSIQSSPMQIYGLPGGDYRVTLSPSSGNQINFQMFDLLGRCVFDKQIENLNRPMSFTVPEGNVPNSPFIAKVNDGNNSIVKKQIPVK